jgi:hypothetical protein
MVLRVFKEVANPGDHCAVAWNAVEDGDRGAIPVGAVGDLAEQGATPLFPLE